MALALLSLVSLYTQSLGALTVIKCYQNLDRLHRPPDFAFI